MPFPEPQDRPVSASVAKVATAHHGRESLEMPGSGRQSLDMPNFGLDSLYMPKLCRESLDMSLGLRLGLITTKQNILIMFLHSSSTILSSELFSLSFD